MHAFSFSNNIRIGNKIIGEGHPCYIIAEAGVNHNGDLGLAKKLIDVALAAGADAVKFQSFKASSLVTQNAPKAKYQERNTQSQASQYEMLSKLEMSYSDFLEMKSHCEKVGITFLSTPFDLTSMVELKKIGIDAIKISSGDITNLPFLASIAAFKIPVILSTGMSTMEEVEEAVAVFRKNDLQDLIVLHCTSEYPCPPKDCNLRAMLSLMEFGSLTGYSDHTVSTHTPAIAVSMGASVIEKHFTLDKSADGPDHAASLDPKELKEMVELVREAELMLGSGIKEPTPDEKETAMVTRKSLIISKSIQQGDELSEEHLQIKRPGTGISPKFLKEVIGRTVNKNLNKDQLLSWEDLQ